MEWIMPPVTCHLHTNDTGSNLTSTIYLSHNPIRFPHIVILIYHLFIT